MIRTCFLMLITCAAYLPRFIHAAEPPNIVLIPADDLGWADVGCYGNTFNETPHIDRLAREGMRFTQFYAGPVCSPTRANLQSGQDQARFGITQHIPGHRRPSYWRSIKLSRRWLVIQAVLSTQVCSMSLIKALGELWRPLMQQGWRRTH